MEIYAPDEWTPTTEKLLANVADDSDLYLQKVSRILYIMKIINHLLSFSI